jgi:Protein of unknown function (DUF3168)
MSIGSWDLQVAIRDRLTLAPIAGGRIFDSDANISPDVLFPYVTIGEGQVIEADVVGSSGSDEAVALHIWDRANAQGGQRGKKNVKLIGDQIHSLLNGQDIAVNGRSPAFVVMRDFVTIADPDPLTVHGVLTMRVQHFEEL